MDENEREMSLLRSEKIPEGREVSLLEFKLQMEDD